MPLLLSSATRSSAIDRKTPCQRRPDTVLDLELGDVLRLRKPHPCGGYDWQVTRLGADIGLRCLTCSRRVLLERPILDRRLKTVLIHAGQAVGLPDST